MEHGLGRTMAKGLAMFGMVLMVLDYIYKLCEVCSDIRLMTNYINRWIYSLIITNEGMFYLTTHSKHFMYG